MRKIFYLLMSGFATVINAQFGGNQDIVNSSIDMYPKTPEAAALSKFVDIPAGNYTGVADFTIPLYTIDFDGEKIPIELRYTTTGVTVGQIATRVGLGWILNTGPSLSQQVIGTQDRVFPRPVITPAFHNPNDAINSNDPSLVLALAALGMDGDGPRDVQPDIYTYNLLNGSGKFIMNPAGTKGIPMPYNQIKITGEYGNPNDIIDEKGFQYKFLNYPSGKTRNTCVETNPEFDFDDPNFKIERITSPKNQTVKYLYDIYPSTYNVQAKYISSIMTQERVSISVFGNPPGIRPWMVLPKKCINYTYSSDDPLTEIQFKGGKVLFTYNNISTNPREDLIGDVYLTKVMVKNDKNEIIKDFTLFYDYFSSVSSTLPDELSDSRLTQYKNGLNKRLKLTSVKDNLTNGTYYLEYYDSYTDPITNSINKLPIRVSNDQDFWGIYNGKNNGQKSISISRYDDLPNLHSQYVGADKNPDINYGKLGNLKKIIYPTGGYSEIQYEADDFPLAIPEIINEYGDYEEYPFRNEDASVPTEIVIPSTALSSKTLTFFTPHSGTTTHGICNWELLNQAGVRVDGGQGGGTFNRTDPPGTYYLKVYQDTGDYIINNNANTCYADYSFTIRPILSSETINTRKMGTIRVSKIESFDNNNGKIVREYTYKIPQPTEDHPQPYTKSSGVNQGEELFLARSTQKYPVGNNGEYVMEVLVSNNPGWQTTTVRGKPIGYDYVQEKYIDYNTPANSYRKEYKFKNDPIPQYHDPSTPLNVNWPVGGLDRGLLEQELQYDSGNHLVKKTVNEYDYDSHFNSKYAPDSGMFGIGGMGSGLVITPTKKFGQGSTSYTFEYTTYPLTNSWIPQKKTTITDYFNNGNDSLKVVKTNNYSIPAYKHTYPTESLSEGSGDILKTIFRYPQDVTAAEVGAAQQQAVLDAMITKNQLSDPIIVKSYKNNTVNAEVKTFYNQYNTNVSGVAMALPRYIYLKKGENANVEDRKITFDSYDNQGNLTQYTLENGIPVSVIWGYNQTKPIAKIEGARLSDISESLISNIVLASTIDNNDFPGFPDLTPEITEQGIIDALDTFRKDSSLASFQITTYTYDPLIGVRSVTPPSGLREYYTYDAAGRLKEVKRAEKNASGNEVLRVLKKNEYHYQQP